MTATPNAACLKQAADTILAADALGSLEALRAADDAFDCLRPAMDQSLTEPARNEAL